MSALVWSTAAGNLTTAIAGTHGTLASGGQAILNALTAAGTIYNARYIGTGVDTAKVAWLAEIAARWANADKIARKFLSPDPGALTLDAYHLPLLFARVQQAQSAKTPPSATVAAALSAAFGDVSTLWSPNRNGQTPFDAFDAFVNDLQIQTSSYLFYRNGDSVRTLELGVSALVDQANDWTAALA